MLHCTRVATHAPVKWFNSSEMATSSATKIEREIGGSPSKLKGEKRYEEIHVLLSDSKGCIKLCKDILTGEKVAIKFINRGAKIDDDVKCGILNHMGLLHQHVIAFKEIFLTSTHLCVVMEYAAGGDLLEYVRNHGINEIQARWIFQQLIIALDHCHKMGIVCREITLEDALLDNSKWPLMKINAFRYSKRLGYQDAEALLKPKGSPAYLAPELIDNRTLQTCTSFKGLDAWQCGVFLYAMLFQSYPFCHPEDRHEADPLRKVLARTTKCEFTFPADTPISADCKDLIRGLLAHPKQRMSLEDVAQHPWFTKDLPSGALNMNKDLRLRRGTKLQSKKEIERIIDEARVPNL